jgi:hypothetical protein
MHVREQTEKRPSTVMARWLSHAEMDRWDNYVRHHPQGLVFHTSLWNQALEQAFPHIQGNVIALTDSETGEIKAGLPIYTVKSWILGTHLVSIPFASVCDPLLSSPSDFDVLLPHLFERKPAGPSAALEVRATHCAEVLESRGFVRNNCYKHHFVRLDKPIDALLASFSQSAVRRMIARGSKAGISVRYDPSPEGLRDFYGLFVQSRKRLGLPPIPGCRPSRLPSFPPFAKGSARGTAEFLSLRKITGPLARL